MAGIVDKINIATAGTFALAISGSTYTAQRTLAADVNETITVPAGAKYAVFGSSGTFACRFNSTVSGAAATFADATGGDTIVINPTVIYLVDIAELSVIAKGDVYMSVAFFS